MLKAELADEASASYDSERHIYYADIFDAALMKAGRFLRAPAPPEAAGRGRHALVFRDYAATRCRFLSLR